jgi:sugar phosphate isomerase/epimerase
LDDSHKLVADVGNRLGAEHLLVVSDEPRADQLATALSTISDWCGPGLRPMLEFLRITEVSSLAQAKELLAACSEHNFGILLDSLHLARSAELDTLVSLDAGEHPYIQLCDGPLLCADDRESLLVDALDLRSAPGEGELALWPLLQMLPADTPLSMEVRSRAYRDAYPDPTERARKILQRTQKFLEEETHE